MSEQLHRIDIQAPTASGRRRGWVKQVISVDLSRRDGYAFEGKFLPNGWNDLPVGAVTVEQRPTGSVKHAGKGGAAYVLRPDGKLERFATVEDWYSPDFIPFRDAVAARVNRPAADPALGADVGAVRVALAGESTLAATYSIDIRHTGEVPDRWWAVVRVGEGGADRYAYVVRGRPLYEPGDAVTAAAAVIRSHVAGGAISARVLSVAAGEGVTVEDVEDVALAAAYVPPAPAVKLLDRVRAMEVDPAPPGEVPPGEFHDRLWAVLLALSALRVGLTHTNHLNDEELYRFLWTEVLANELPEYSGEGAWSLDVVGSGSDEDIALYLRHYAAPEERAWWAEDWPELKIPDHEDPPYDRDASLQRLLVANSPAPLQAYVTRGPSAAPEAPAS